MIKDKSSFSTFREEIYNKMVENNQIIITKYLRLEPYPRNHGVYGFSGWDQNRVGKNYKVYDGRMGENEVFLSTWYAQFLGECFFRFATTRSSWKSPGSGRHRRFIVETSIMGRTQLLYFIPSGKLAIYITNALRTMTDEDCHEYVWRIHKNTFGNGETNLDCYYHDIDLQPIERKKLSVDHLKIIDSEIGNKCLWDTHPPDTELNKSERKVLEGERLSTTVRHMKDKVIPRLPHRPREDDYISLLMDLAGATPSEAQKVWENRSYYRLP